MGFFYYAREGENTIEGPDAKRAEGTSRAMVQKKDVFFFGGVEGEGGGNTACRFHLRMRSSAFFFCIVMISFIFFFF